jgi:activator of 2-hydroxyglutaryl-CoA dehydratase
MSETSRGHAEHIQAAERRGLQGAMPRPVKITTVCTVFVESDILSYLAQDHRPEDILGGVHLAIARRTVSLARRVAVEPEVTMTGGVARNIGMVSAIEQVLGRKLQVSPDAHYMGAVGAGLFALEKLDQSFESGVWREHATGRGH